MRKTMADAFSSPKQLITHARDEINEVARLLTEFASKQKGIKVVYNDFQAGQQVFCVRITGPELPPKVSNRIKDVASNLRDALDHAVYSSAIAINGGSPSNTGFPFARDAAGINGELNGKRLSGNPSEIRSLLASFHPYDGGNDAIWGLNQLRNANTHRFIVPVGSAAIFGGLGIGSGVIAGNSMIGYNRWNATKNEVEYMRLGFGSYAKHQVNITVSVQFEDIKAVAGKEVIGTLNLMADETFRIVSAIEAETLKIISAKT